MGHTQDPALPGAPPLMFPPEVILREDCSVIGRVILRSRRTYRTSANICFQCCAFVWFVYSKDILMVLGRGVRCSYAPTRKSCVFISKARIRHCAGPAFQLQLLPILSLGGGGPGVQRWCSRRRVGTSSAAAGTGPSASGTPTTRRRGSRCPPPSPSPLVAFNTPLQMALDICGMF